MKLSGNTVLVTGGASGIGRGIAEAFHNRGNAVIIAGRRRNKLDEVVKANPGMHAIELNIADPENIASVAGKLTKDFPKLNVLINNAGVMHIDDVAGPIDDTVLDTTLRTNLMGPIRLTSALIEHLKLQETAYVMNVTSGLAFIPLATSAIYSASKAALHSYSLSLRYMLTGTSVKVLEIAPPWVQTELLNSKDEPRAMSLSDFLNETMDLLASTDDEIVTQRAHMLRDQAGPNEGAFVVQFNNMIRVPEGEGALPH
ncbi:MAG: SDR family NAD(P)-dependent oxidoreductase [Cyanobacteria bacterium]|nr:SDR family NAD(P)-dependent oxidoreductase [Cyanobacteriota bacterium]